MTDPRKLVATLSLISRQALEQAAARALRETHATVELEHLLLELCCAEGSDLAALLREEGWDTQGLLTELEAAIARFARGSVRLPALSADLLAVLSGAWVIASVDLGLRQTGSAAILTALADDAARRAASLASVPALARLLDSAARRDLQAWVQRGAESTVVAPRAGGDGAALAAYTIDLTAEARAGKLDGAIGRQDEIRQLVDVLMRRQQNNPLLAGPAGVGKTSIVEGLACLVAANRVPPSLSGLTVRSLDLGALQAGAAMRGEFEQRLRAVLDEAAAAQPRTVLFIDEAHMLVGAGGAAGQSDAANLLKPALARGALGVIAATTWGEYKRFIEKDPALARRFQVIRVDEPSETVAVEILRALAPKLETHHGVPVLEEALAEAVRLSGRFIAGRQLPEKAISVLDTACARVAIARSTPPPELEEAEHRAASLAAELTRLKREALAQPDQAARVEELEEAYERAAEAQLRWAGRWALEQEAGARLEALQARLNAGASEDALYSTYAGLELELEEVRQERGAPSRVVDARAIADVIAGWTGIPVGRMLADTLANARSLKGRMAERVVEQDAALDVICRRIQTFFAELGEPNKPTGVFLLCGPSGVGKTETALTLADLLFGGPRALITVNMTEYQEAHSISSLRGAPPGYVGYGRGGVLTEAVRRQPYSVVLLDEVEKAHPDVLEMFYQVFDRGMLEDSEGQLVDFTNTVILLTSNVGADELVDAVERRPDADATILASAIHSALLRQFPAAFLGRMTVVPYRPLGLAGMEAVARLKLAYLQERFAGTQRGELTYDPALPRVIAKQAGTTSSGARMVDAILSHAVLPALSARILDQLAEGRPISGAHLALASNNAVRIEIRE
jgi:type VI secretion system protein VasG